MTSVIECRDVLEWCQDYEGPKFHALLCDPPYHLYDAKGKPAGAPDGSRSNPFERTKGSGFMGCSWDGGDIAFRSGTWTALAEHLLPGAFIAAFTSTRGFHHQAIAMECAGLVIRPMCGWLTCTSFPKAQKIADERFAGRRYGGQVLKNSLEVILIAQKPYVGKPVDSISKTGTGTLWIDGCRIPYQDEGDKASATPQGACTSQPESLAGKLQIGGHREEFTRPEQKGRWPSNLVLQHHRDCNDVCAPECPVAKLNERTGIRKSGMMKADQRQQKSRGRGGYHGDFPDIVTKHGTYGDSGQISRFFFQSDWRLENMEAVFYCQKAARSERDAGLSDSEWARKNPCHAVRNLHPTVKPLKLCQHLATLLLPPVEYAPRRLLVPFAGAASEMIGGAFAGWEEIVGIEKVPEYCEVARKRIEYWARWGRAWELPPPRREGPTSFWARRT